jgi:hypothetical protein
VDVVALCRPKSDDLWALGHDPRRFRTRTALLHCRAGGWDWAFAVKRRLDSIATLCDGSVLAVGEQLSVLFDGYRWSTIGSGLKGSRRIWGAHPACANALTEQGLFYFDGQTWARVDLGISGAWADGDCDSGGAGWIVGTHGSHSCMAAGSGTNWRADGCGSWYLYLVYVGEGGRAFAAGGDGLWRHDGTRWTGMDDHRDVSRLPLAVSAVGPSPIVVATKMRNLVRPTPELEVLTAAGWQTIRIPITIVLAHPARIEVEVDIGGRLLVAWGSTVWISSRLTSS